MCTQHGTNRFLDTALTKLYVGNMRCARYIHIQTAKDAWKGKEVIDVLRAKGEQQLCNIKSPRDQEVYAPPLNLADLLFLPCQLSVYMQQGG